MKRQHAPVYYHVRFLIRAAMWLSFAFGLAMVATHLWWNGHHFIWTSNPFGN